MFLTIKVISWNPYQAITVQVQQKEYFIQCQKMLDALKLFKIYLDCID